jgi:hypothetical protein
MEARFAKETFAAGDGEGDDDAIADLQRLVLGPDLDDFAHRLMAQHIALFHGGHDAVEQVQIGAADRAGGDLDDGIARVLDLRIRHRLATNVVLAMPGECFHRTVLRADNATYQRRHQRWFLFFH